MQFCNTPFNYILHIWEGNDKSLFNTHIHTCPLANHVAQDQGQSDTILDDLSCMLGCTRSSLHGESESDFWFFGCVCCIVSAYACTPIDLLFVRVSVHVVSVCFVFCTMPVSPSSLSVHACTLVCECVCVRCLTHDWYVRKAVFAGCQTGDYSVCWLSGQGL